MDILAYSMAAWLLSVVCYIGLDYFSPVWSIHWPVLMWFSGIVFGGAAMIGAGEVVRKVENDRASFFCVHFAGINHVAALICAGTRWGGMWVMLRDGDDWSGPVLIPWDDIRGQYDYEFVVRTCGDGPVTSLDLTRLDQLRTSLLESEIGGLSAQGSGVESGERTGSRINGRSGTSLAGTGGSDRVDGGDCEQESRSDTDGEIPLSSIVGY